MNDVGFEDLVDRLTKESNAGVPADVARSSDAQRAGLYSWWADEAARRALAKGLGHEIGPLIYVGQAGATSKHSAKASNATLGSRIRNNHLGGDIGSSTFRKTLAALLRDELALEVVDENRLSPPSSTRLSEWMAAHLRLTIVAVDDPVLLTSLEEAVVGRIDAPLNLKGVERTTGRTMLQQLRRALREQLEEDEPAADSPITTPHLHVVQNEGGVEVVDGALGSMMRLDIGTLETPNTAEASPQSTLLAVAALAAKFPEVRAMLQRSDSIHVAFTPEVTRLLREGHYTMMRSSSEMFPIALDAGGRIVSTARVVPEAGAIGGVALGTAGVVAWPVLLAAAAGAAAAYAEQRWLEQTFGELQRAVERVERRMRDDDAGVLEGAARLVAVARPSVTRGIFADQFRLELAVARRDVDALYFSRRRYIHRFTAALEQDQNKHESKTGERYAWAPGVSDELGDRKSGLLDELVLFLQAMIARAQLGACTAAALAADGDSGQALRLLEQLHQEVREEYTNLARRIRPLAGTSPQAKWHRLRDLSDRWSVPFFNGIEDGRGADLIRALYEQMHATIGVNLPPRDAEVLVSVRSSEVLQLAQVSTDEK
ncbi:MAG: hypothetical protein JWO36_6949 [Myxococcales bacterium]|nr:hypothetical protein [Myxococcales bacterium]